MENLIAWFVSSLLVLVPIWRIFGRAGLPPALALLSLIPLFGLFIVIAVLAFTAWPAHSHRGGN